jgi:excinuclease ABC subunit C
MVGIMFSIEEELKKLPDRPGVYIMRDKENKIIYVGKAISLKNRVRSYFRKTNKTQRILNMVSLIDYFEYIVVDNEAEALILECNLIKENRPKFNVLLKDDKTYPYIKIDVKSDYPGVQITRKFINDGSKYFGPYANPGAAKEMLDFIKQRYKIRQCKNFKYTDRPCLNYHIKRCLAPCMGYVPKEEYRKQIDEIIDFLDGKQEKVIKEIEKQMKEASERLDFEQAAYLRDKKLAIERVGEKQKVSNISENNIDVIGMSKSDLEVCIEIFFVRGSKMIGREHYFLPELKEMEDKEILGGFIKQYYLDKQSIPNKIMLREELDDKKAIELWLSGKINGRKVELISPKKGEKLRFVEMAENNSKVTLENKEKDKNSILLELKEVLNLDKLPRKIETFDISNIGGEYTVAGMCVMQDGIIKKNLARRFKIKTVVGQDDVACMEEVVTRRIKHSIESPNGGFGTLPDVIFADGGITQIKAIQKAISKYGLDIPVYGMVKNDKHQTRALMSPKRKELKISEGLMKVITNFQDEVHNTAISYHRKLRDGSMNKSDLDEINGIGQVKKQLLLKRFGSIENMKKASLEELMEVKGITEEIAKNIKK